MARRVLSESGYYHIVVRSAGQIALFEDDNDRRKYLRLLRQARDTTGARIIAWVLMTDHVHLVVDFGETPEAVTPFMLQIDSSYSRYFNATTGRSGTLFQGEFWSKPIIDDAQLMATVHYVHMNPEAAGIAAMRAYRWSSYQEYAGKRWVVSTEVVMDLFGSFDEFDSYEGSPKDVVRDPAKWTSGDPAMTSHAQDNQVLGYAMKLAGVSSSSELRVLPRSRRNELIRTLSYEGVSGPMIARTFGIGTSTVSRVLRS